MVHSKYVHNTNIHNLSAPREVVPVLSKLLNPRSVLDVGCGTGTWLKAFEEIGVTDYTGIDTDSVPIEQLLIPASKFLVKDIGKAYDLQRKFDLIICLEVAEHLPEESADELVASLVKHGDVILFSAAIPYQGGQHHVNEQWPPYWQAKFKAYGYSFYDAIRPMIWNNERVDWWYRQNIFLVSKFPLGGNEALSMVHPQLYLRTVRLHQQYLNSILEGRQGLRIAVRIFLNSILFKVRSLLTRS